MDRRLGIRVFWLLVGLLATMLAMAGVILPLLPTTPFLLIAAFAFARSSSRLSRWLHEHRHFGPLIEDWQRHGAISKRAKVAAMVAIAATPLVSLAIGVTPWIIAVQLAILGCVSLFILTRPSGPEGEPQ